MEIIVALKKLGEALTPEEMRVLEASDEAMKQFEIADKAIGAVVAALQCAVLWVPLHKSATSNHALSFDWSAFVMAQAILCSPSPDRASRVQLGSK